MKIKIKKLSSDAVMPTKAHPTDAGFDLVATSRNIDDYGNLVYGTGLAFEIPEGYVGFLFPRSSISKKNLILTNSVGVLDCHYRGEVTFKFKGVDFWSGIPRVYDKGDRIGQLVVMPIPEIKFEFADKLSETDRGEGGYGSTGR